MGHHPSRPRLHPRIDADTSRPRQELHGASCRQSRSTQTTKDHYWTGRSLKELGRVDESQARFDQLARTTPVAVDDTLPLERRMRAVEERANGFFLKALGFYGLGRKDDARGFLMKALRADPFHLEAVAFQRSMPGPEPRPSGPVRRQRRRPSETPLLPTEAPPERPLAEASPTRAPAEAPPGAIR